MDRITARVVAFAFACTSVVTAVGAASQADQPVPRLVKFTGVVAGVQGTAVALTFAFYPDQANETPLWTETQRVTVDETGRYAVTLGASRPEGLPLHLFAAGEARWLGVRVEGQVEQPRVLLVSVPYALKAADAETVGGKPLSAFVLAGDRTGVGADGLTYVDTRVLATGLTGPPSPGPGFGAASGMAPGGAGSANYIGLFTDTTTLGNSVIYQTPAGSVGVNTTAPLAGFHAVSAASPAAYFDVYSNALGALPVIYRAARGTVATPTAVQTDDILGGLAVRGYGSTGFTAGRGQVMFKAAENWTDAANGTYLQLTTTPTGSTGWLERMRISPSGNVGIGTAAPAQRLSVAGTIESTTGGFLFPDGTTQTTAALIRIASAAGNTAVGDASFGHNTTGTWNTAFGDSTLAANTTGLGNSAFGTYALTSMTTGRDNNAFGADALASNQTGEYNSVFGSYSGGYSTGSRNSLFGARIMMFTVGGDDNTAVGAEALASSQGDRNTAVGLGAGGWVTGSDNTFIGARADTDNTHQNISNATAIGAYATVLQSNSLVLGPRNGSGREVNVGIGTAAPGAKLDVDGDVRASGNVQLGAGRELFFGDFGQIRSYDDNHRIAWDRPANKVTWREYGDVYFTVGSAGTYSVAITRDGRMGVGTTTPLDELHVVGNARFSGCVRVGGVVLAGVCSSDARLKRDVRPFGPVLDRVAGLEPVHFTWRVEEFPARNFDRAENTGLIAQDVERLFPELVSTDDRGFRQVNYGELPYLTLAAVKELKAENDALRVRADKKDEQVRKLTEQLDALTQAVTALRDRRQ